MKYLHEAVIIAAVTFAAEIIKFFIPLPVPASIYGLILLFVLLKSGVVKLEQIEHVGGLLLELMPLLLVFPLLWGIDGILWAGPAADLAAFLVTLVFILLEMKEIRRREAEQI